MMLSFDEFGSGAGAGAHSAGQGTVWDTALTRRVNMCGHDRTT